jgi:hypothetical protein
MDCSWMSDEKGTAYRIMTCDITGELLKGHRKHNIYNVRQTENGFCCPDRSDMCAAEAVLRVRWQCIDESTAYSLTHTQNGTWGDLQLRVVLDARSCIAVSLFSNLPIRAL